MAVTILLRRGTKTQLDGITLSAGELGFTTDTNEVYVGDGSNHHLVGKVIVDVFSNRPTAGVSGRLFHATDTDATYVDDGTNWVDVSGGISDLDDVADGTTYGRVRQSELDDGYVKQLRTSAAGDIVTASGIKSHIDDDTIHRSINDSGSGATDLWSAQKIGNEIDSAIAGLDFQADVLNKQTDATLDPGATPSVGDRYIITAAGSLHVNFGTITGLANNDIVEYETGGFVVAYDVSDAGEGALVWNRDADYFEHWDGSSWSEFGGLSGVTAGDGLTKSGNTLNVGAGDGISVSADAVAVSPSDFTGAGLEVNGGDIRIAASAAGDGLTGGAGSALAVGAGDGIDVTADAVAVDVTDIIGTGLSEDASNNIRIGAQGNGIGGGNGSTLSVTPDSTTGATVAPVSVTANGVGVVIDNDSLNHTTGTIEVVKVDGGSFV